MTRDWITELDLAAKLYASWIIQRERMYYGQSRDVSDTYTRARHVRVLTQRGILAWSE